VGDLIARILKCHVLAVTGVSRDPRKFGHRIYFFLKNAGYEVYSVNPNADCLQEDPCYASLDDLPVMPEAVVTVTQPWITSGTVKDAARLGIPYVWMQPGSEPREIDASPGLEIVHGGPCIMVEFNAAHAR
jgi:predicted CoA-binding protein